MRSSLLAVGSVSVFGLMGCGLPSSADVADADTTSQTAAGIVVVEHGAQGGDAVIARFVRVRQGVIDEPALRLAGVPELPSPSKGCVAPSEAPVTFAARQVDLLNVGSVTLEGSQSKTSLYPRQMPDPAGVVSGVFYSARTSDSFGTLRASGGADLPEGFAVNIPSPREIGDVTIGSSIAGLDVAWDATDSDPHDIVYLEVVSSTRVVTRCATTDTGRFLVPLSSIAFVGDGEVVVHRIHTEPFLAKGISPGEVRFDVSRATAFRR
jgi:hypothetical protein